MKRAHAYRLIESSAVVGNLSPIGDIPATESQARPLAALPPEERADASATVANATRTTTDGRQYPATRRTSKPATPEKEEAAAQKRRTLHGRGCAPYAPTSARRQPRAHAPAILRGTPPHSARLAAGSGPLRPVGLWGRAASPAPGHRAPDSRAPRAPGRSPGGSPPPVQRGAHSPCAGPRSPLAQPIGSPPMRRRSANRSATPRRIRPPLPSFPPKPPFPAVAQLQSKLDRLMRSRPQGWPGVTHPRIMFTLGGTPRRGTGRLLFPFFTPPAETAGSAGRSDSDCGEPRRLPAASRTAAPQDAVAG